MLIFRRSWKYNILPEARQEFLDAVDWYAARGVEGLHIRFTEAVQLVIARIQNNPFAFSVRYRNVRVARTQVFPYAIHFLMLEDKMEITITAIIYEGRAPEATKRRFG